MDGWLDHSQNGATTQHCYIQTDDDYDPAHNSGFSKNVLLHSLFARLPTLSTYLLAIVSSMLQLSHLFYSVSQKPPPPRFSEIFSQTVGNF